MSDYDPSELLLVCDSIIEDGELIYDELYQLAEWLNSHQEACLRWLGNLLVEPLRKAWADGKITKTESCSLRGCSFKFEKKLQSVRRSKVVQAVEIAAQTVYTFDLEYPRLPANPFSTRIKSYMRKGEFYEVDLSGPTCSCPDFRSFRQRLPMGHLTRCRKHIFDAYAPARARRRLAGLASLLPRLAHFPHPEQKWPVLKITLGRFSLGGQTSFVLISSPQNHWANIFTSDNGAYDPARSNRKTARKSEKR